MAKLIVSSDAKELNLDIFSACCCCGTPIEFSRHEPFYIESPHSAVITFCCVRCKGRSRIRITLNDTSQFIKVDKNAK